MQNMLRNHAEQIYKKAINENMPNQAVKNALSTFGKVNGKLVLISIGKAGWEMARTAYELLGNEIDCGVVITKYGHSKGSIGNLEIYEAGHPVVDFDGISATKRALELTKDLRGDDVVLFLVSGGGSALFESVDCSLEEAQRLTEALLTCGAEITEINAIRKHLSNVKGGRFAEHIYPAQAFAIALSDVVGNDLSTIASGPTCADNTTVDMCLEILEKYDIQVDNAVLSLIKRETPKEIKNAKHIVSGSVAQLCKSAYNEACALGYKVKIVNDSVVCDVGMIASELERTISTYKDTREPLAFIYGGEITVQVKGEGKGGRNQEIALRMAEKINGIENIAFFSVGSDGTDGPTDSAGGYVDGTTWENIKKAGKNPGECLKNNDSYNALSVANSLIFTGPTGTNVNDLYVLLMLPR